MVKFTKSELRQIIKEEIQKLNEESFDQKDKLRIQSIVDKAKNNDHMIKLAKTMANKIKDSLKARRRGNAAKDLGKDEIAKIFFDRSDELDKPESTSAYNKRLVKKIEKNIQQHNSYVKKRKIGEISFPKKAMVALWVDELLGQISDGWWENSRPYGHYKAPTSLVVKVGPPKVTFNKHTYIPGMSLKKYNFANSQLLSIVGDRMLELIQAYDSNYTMKDLKRILTFMSKVWNNAIS